MKFRLVFALVLMVTGTIHANEFWKKDYSRVDSLALTIKSTGSIEELAFQLTKSYSSDLEKYRSIFTWVSNNISYDLVALKYPGLRETDPLKVISNGRAVCAGYCRLFSRLCEIAKLECVTIAGWAKNKEDIGRPLNIKTDHSWNAIKISGDWYLCDPTWGAGSTTDDAKTFTFAFKDFYFCTPPMLFAYNHFPKEKKWLLGITLSEKKFISRPHFYPEVINQNTRDLRPDDGVIDYKKNGVLECKFFVDGVIEQIWIQPSKVNKSTEIEFTVKDGMVEFNYIMDSYSPYLYVHVNGKPFLVYKMKKS